MPLKRFDSRALWAWPFVLLNRTFATFRVPFFLRRRRRKDKVSCRSVSVGWKNN